MCFVFKFVRHTIRFFCRIGFGGTFFLGCVLITNTQAATYANPYHLAWHCFNHHGTWACRIESMPGALLYQSTASPEQKKGALIAALGWQANDSGQNQHTLCGGHYYFPVTPLATKTLDASKTNIISGLPQYQLGGALTLSHGVVVKQSGRRLYAEKVFVTPDSKTGKLKTIHAQGNIQLRQPGVLILGRDLNANLVSHQATLNDVHYLAHLVNGTNGQPVFRIGQHYFRSPVVEPNFTGFAHGSATKAVQKSKTQYVFHQATYSTCPPTHADWAMHMSKITLNNKTQIGVAKNVVLKFYHIPIFYTPYFSFPLNNQRKSGLLYPLLNYSSNYGYYYGQPIYLNLAPNYDDTITPQYYTKRGLMLGNRFRLLTKHGYYNAALQWVPRDQITKESRYGFFFNGQRSLPDGFNVTGEYDQVSDNNYLRDFSNQNFGGAESESSSLYNQSNAAIASVAILPRNLTLSRNGAHWNFSAQVSSYKIIGDLETENQPYNLLPSISLTGQYPNLLKPLALSLITNYTNFQKSGAVSGQRLYAIPSLSLSLQKIYGFFVPTLSLNTVRYDLTNNSVNHINRTLPVFDIDTGLYFDRDFSFLGSNYSQKVEPQLFYLFVPYTNQDDIPIFDTTINTLTYSQLFNTNLFSGEDRIENANQISAALSSTIDNAAGSNVLSADIGQIFYFQNRRVALCPGQSCLDNELPHNKSSISPILTQLTYYFNSAWQLQSDVNYRLSDHNFEYQQYALQYQPDTAHIFNLGYQNNQADYGLLSTAQIQSGQAPPSISQVSASFLWGLTPHWHLVGDVNYSLNNATTLSAFGGLEYDTCCWKILAVVDNYLTSTNANEPNVLNGPRTTGIMFQFTLKGLGSQAIGGNGANQIQGLLSTIPGYNSAASGFN